MLKPDLDDKIHPVVKIAVILDALAAEGVLAKDALAGSHLSKSAASSPETRVSLTQVLACCRNADRLSKDRHFAYHAGLQFHISAYGLYGFAMLCSTDYRQTMRFAVEYHQLATPLVEILFSEEGRYAIWTFTPISLPRVDARLYKFLVELQFGILMSLHRDIMGPAFLARELRVSYPSPGDAATYPIIFGCRALFGETQNKFIFDRAWLDKKAELGNQIIYPTIVKLCDAMAEEFQLRVGLAGKVRQILLVNLMRPTNFGEVARQLNMSTRTLRRRLHQENTSFRKLAGELRTVIATKYLCDTDLTVEDISHLLGFSEPSSFRQAFRRWTNVGPQQFRDVSGKG